MKTTIITLIIIITIKNSSAQCDLVVHKDLGIGSGLSYSIPSKNFYHSFNGFIWFHEHGGHIPMLNHDFGLNWKFHYSQSLTDQFSIGFDKGLNSILRRKFESHSFKRSNVLFGIQLLQPMKLSHTLAGFKLTYRNDRRKFGYPKRFQYSIFYGMYTSVFTSNHFYEHLIGIDFFYIIHLSASDQLRRVMQKQTKRKTEVIRKEDTRGPNNF